MYKIGNEHFVDEFPKGGHPYCWVVERVPRCPHAACRRAARCVKPQMVPGRGPPRWPSCPLVTHKEWACWGVGMRRAMMRSLERRYAEQAEAEAAERAAQRRGRGKAG